MADGKIRREDLFDEGVFKAFNELKSQTDLMVSNFKKFIDEARRLNKELSGSESFKKYSQTTKKTNTNVKELTLTQKEHQKSVAQLQREQAKLNLVYTEENKELERVKRERRFARKEIDAEKGSISQLRAENARLADQRDKLNVNTKRGRAEIARLNSAINQNNAVIRKNSDALTRQKIGIGKYTQAITGLIPKILGQAGLVGGFFLLFKTLRNGAKVVSDYDSATRKLASILGTTRENTKELNDEAKLLGSLSKFTATQVTELQTELAKLGFTVDEISASTPGIIDFATATGAELGSAAKTAAIALRVFNKDASQMNDVVAALAVGTTKSALAFEDYETILSTVGPVANSYNFTLEDTIGLTGRLRDAGFDASSAATATRNILLNLADANGDLAKSLGRPIKSLDDMVAGLVELDEKGVSLAETLELTDKRSVAAFNRFLTGAESARDLRDAVSGANDQLERMVEEQMKSLDNQIKLLKSAWEGLILSIESGEGVIARAVTGTLSILTDALTELANLDLIFTRTSKLTEDQVRRTYDVLSAMSRAKEGIKFQEVIDEFEKVNYVLLQFDETQEKAFKNSLDNAGFNAKEQVLLWDEYLRRRKEQFESEVKATQDYQKRLTENQIKEEKLRLKAAEDAFTELRKLAKDDFSDEEMDFINWDLQLEKAEESVDDYGVILEELSKKTLEEQDEVFQDFLEKEQQKRKAIQQTLDSFKTFFEARGQFIKNDIERLQNQRDFELKTSEDTAEAKTKIEEKYSDELTKLRQKQAKNEKIQSLFSVAINTARAIAEALPNIPLSILVGAIGAVQAAAIIAQPIPQFEKGTDSSPEGSAIVGEKGSELMIDRKGNVGFSPDKPSLTYLEQGTKVIPADITRQIMSNTIMANVMMSKGKGSEARQIIDELKTSNDKLRMELRKKPVSSVNIDSSGISVMTRSERTLQKRIDKYFRT